ncbi:MAG: Fic family protein [Bacilli bacterium]
MDFNRADVLKKKLDDYRPLPAEVVANLRDVFTIEWTYNSNAIEGNTLTLLETKLVVEEGLTIGGKKLKEHFEAINHVEAIQYVEALVQNEIPLTLIELKNMHHLILKNVDDQNAGIYRRVNVRISGSEHRPPHFTALLDEMDELFRWYQLNKDHLHPIELASFMHFKFVYIHPFSDGNGRTARLLMNLILMQHGYPPAVIKAKNESRMKYYEALEEGSVSGNIVPFVQLVRDCVEESLEEYLDAIGVK